MTRDWDIALRGTAIVGALAIPAVVVLHRAEPLVLLALAVLWLRSPAAAFSLVGLEPLLMLYGRLYPVWLVVAVATAASIVGEALSMHVMRGVMDLRVLDRIRGTLQGSRVMRLFERRPSLTIAFVAFSPIPDGITRSIAAVARYPIGRYVVADTLGRMPKIWIPVALGAVLMVPAAWLLGISIGSVVLGALVVSGRWIIRARSVPSAATRSIPPGG